MVNNLEKLITIENMSDYRDESIKRDAYLCEYEIGKSGVVSVDEETGEHTYGDIDTIAKGLDVANDRIGLIEIELNGVSSGLDKILND